MNICIKYNVLVWVYWMGEHPFRPACLMEDHLFTTHKLDVTFAVDREVIFRHINEENKSESELAADLAKSMGSGSSSVPNITRVWCIRPPPSTCVLPPMISPAKAISVQKYHTMSATVRTCKLEHPKR